ncbi:MAG: hypothetical protein IPN95_29390 [Bacteroidetes bacterium]|nr:hypothetical protein [Bacteroidota bacterium]
MGLEKDLIEDFLEDTFVWSTTEVSFVLGGSPQTFGIHCLLAKMFQQFFACFCSQSLMMWNKMGKGMLILKNRMR